MEDQPPTSYNEACARISPFLGPLLNFLEDARINALTMKARPGMKVMFDSRAVRTFEQGIENADGTRSLWRDAPLNPQVMAGVFCLASGYNFEGWFQDEVQDALHDPELQKLVAQATQSDSVADLYRLAFPILEKLRELGFCTTKEDEPEPEPEPDAEDTGGDSDSEGDPESSGEKPSQEEQENPGADGPKMDDTDDDDADDDGGADAGDTADEDGPDTDDEASDGSGAPDDDAEPEGDQGPDESGGDAGGSPFGDPESFFDDDAKPGEAEDGNAPGDESSGEGGSGGGGSESEPEDDPYGTPEDIEAALNSLCSHDHDDGGSGGEAGGSGDSDADDMDRAIAQDRDFDTPSQNVYQVKIIDQPDGSGFDARIGTSTHRVEDVPERVIQQSLGKMRIAFSENRKGSQQRNLKTGKVNAKVLGRRVPVSEHNPSGTDPRIFKKRKRPGKRDYLVVLGLDISYSTNSRVAYEPGAPTRLQVIKTAAFAQAELLDRIGVPFEIWAHTGIQSEKATDEGGYYGRYLECVEYQVKRVDERWDTATKRKLEMLAPASANLDGHSMEFYRKRMDKSDATTKVLMYYTDGSMPAENYEEELEILTRNLRECKQRGYEVVGVGVRTDSPKEHGMDTVLVNNVEDVPKVVQELHKRLTR
jgi:hypothetical protein